MAFPGKMSYTQSWKLENGMEHRKVKGFYTYENGL